MTQRVVIPVRAERTAEAREKRCCPLLRCTPNNTWNHLCSPPCTVMWFWHLISLYQVFTSGPRIVHLTFDRCAGWLVRFGLARLVTVSGISRSLQAVVNLMTSRLMKSDDQDLKAGAHSFVVLFGEQRRRRQRRRRQQQRRRKRRRKGRRVAFRPISYVCVCVCCALSGFMLSIWH